MAVNHVGLAVHRIDAAVKMFRVELAELTPDSLQRKAIDSWK